MTAKAGRRHARKTAEGVRLQSADAFHAAVQAGVANTDAWPVQYQAFAGVIRTAGT